MSKTGTAQAYETQFSMAYSPIMHNGTINASWQEGGGGKGSSNKISVERG